MSKVPEKNCAGCVKFDCCDVYKEVAEALKRVAFRRDRSGQKTEKLLIPSQIASVCLEFLPTPLWAKPLGEEAKKNGL